MDLVTKTIEGVQLTATTQTNACNIIFENDEEIDLTQFVDAYKKVCLPAKLVKRFNLLTDEEKKSLLLINQDEQTAIELCYVIAANLSNTYFTSLQVNVSHNKINGWKRLHSRILQDQVSSRKTTTYLRVVEFLQKIEAIEVNRQFEIGVKCMSYRFTFDYFTPKMTTVTLSSKKVLDLRMKSWLHLITNMAKHPIERETLRVMSMTKFLTYEEILEIGRKKAKEGYSTKKGKKLTFIGKKTKEYFKDFEKNRVAVEDGANAYRFLIEQNGIFMPSAAKNAGGRVATCFNLLPMWIREEMKLEGIEFRDEKDFTCLHPNIVSPLFGGTGEHISHDMVVDELFPQASAEEKAQKRIEVKIEHLSFFNKPLKSGMYDGKFVPGMEASILFPFYMKKEPKMMEALIQSKAKNGYKSTAKALFEIEVKMMTEIVRRVNFALPDCRMIYVYDALEVDIKYSDAVKKIMNDVAKEVGVNTFVK